MQSFWRGQRSITKLVKDSGGNPTILIITTHPEEYINGFNLDNNQDNLDNEFV